MRVRALVVGAVVLLLIVVSYASEPLRGRSRALDAVDVEPRQAADARGAVSMNVEAFEPSRDALVATGSVYAKATFEMTEAELSEIEARAPEFWDHLRLAGWEREGNAAVRLVPARGAVIRRDGEEITIRESRYAFVEGRGLARSAREEFNRDPRVVVEVEGVRVPAERVKVLRSASAAGEPLRADVVLTFNLRDTAPGMCHIDAKDSRHKVQANATGSPMNDLRCLDYNGPFSDGGNYDKNTWRAFYNFMGSDCELALYKGYCWTEHFTGRGCSLTHGGKTCSVLIGHSPNYHKHKFF
jgi:hypothetical protein